MANQVTEFADIIKMVEDIILANKNKDLKKDDDNAFVKAFNSGIVIGATTDELLLRIIEIQQAEIEKLRKQMLAANRRIKAVMINLEINEEGA